MTGCSVTSFKHKLDKYLQTIPGKPKIPGYTIETDTNSITSMRSSRESWAIQLRQSHRLGRRDYTLKLYELSFPQLSIHTDTLATESPTIRITVILFNRWRSTVNKRKTRCIGRCLLQFYLIKHTHSYIHNYSNAVLMKFISKLFYLSKKKNIILRSLLRRNKTFELL